MRYRLAVAAVILQVLALAYMGGEREWILRTGRSVLLRTAPLDPNDPMRGDYARLDYEISHVPRSRFEGDLAKRFAQPPDGRRTPERRVYGRLEVGGDGVADLVALSDVKPAEGLFVRGFTQNSFGHSVRVRYGIEALFMQQGTAQKLEDMRLRERPGVPLDIEVAVSSSGIAVLKNYKWEPLGITVTFERTPASARPGRNVPGVNQPQQFITGVNVELKNYGPEDVAVVDLPEGGSLRLVADDRWQETRFRWSGEGRTPPPPKPEHVFILKPGQSYKMSMDLTQPAWFVVNTTPTGDNKPIALRDVTEAWSASFRVEYSPPRKESVVDFPNANLIRHGRLRSRAFNPTAGLD